MRTSVQFFDTLDHGWLVKFVEHRIADRRVVRLIQKWLKAGVLEEGKRMQSEVGTVQGGSISPLLANVYLHYVFDLWVQRWRKKQAHGDVVVVRFADDFVVGFEHREEAERFLAELRERFAKFGLELHPDKTRLVEFGRFAERDRRNAVRASRRPSTSWASRTAAGRRGRAVHGAAADDAQEVAGEAAGGQSRTAATHARRPSRSRARTCAAVARGARPILRRAHERPGARRLPVGSRAALVADPAPPQSEAPPAVAPDAASASTVGFRPRASAIRIRSALRRYHPRWEPDAVMPLVRICGGGYGRSYPYSDSLFTG